VNTHLETVSTPEILPIQLAQAQELVSTFEYENKPVIIVGDFNSRAPNGETYHYILSQDYVDIWTRNILNINPDGFTSSQDPDLRNAESKLDHRIDFIFVGNELKTTDIQLLGPVAAVVVGDEQQDRTKSGLWPSDHAGVAAKLIIPNPRFLSAF
jgi:endonuclease/exonuclease/phosphatase family metal-dependent hydrolase